MANNRDYFYNGYRFIEYPGQRIPMSRRNIILLVVCTLILIVVSISTIQKEPGIREAFLSSSKDPSQDEIETDGQYYYFEDLESDIYLILSVKDLATDDQIIIKWNILENGTEELLQENTIYPDQNGSGEIVVSFVKRNESYAQGLYRVDIYLNNDSQLFRQFLLSGGE